tara:strand:+ start:552 stop:764 length:213 start_codon:yes stop_codon:yes gene_type:complete
MSRYNSDALDEACEEMLGHTNWSYADTQDLEKIIAERKGDIPKDKEIEHIVIFYTEPDEDDDENEEEDDE